MKKGTINALIILLIIVLVLWAIAWYLDYKQRQKQIKQSAEAIDLQRMLLLMKDIQTNKEGDISTKLLEKKKWFDTFAPAYSKDLNEIAILYKEEINETAILKTAKLLENFLKHKYSKTSPFIAWKQNKYPNVKGKPTFEKYLEYALSINDITKDEFNFITGIKHIRNQEAHQINVKYGSNMCNAAIYTFLHIVDEFEKRNLIPV